MIRLQKILQTIHHQNQPAQ